MNEIKTRYDAAQMLGLNTDATPDMVMPAYKERLRQFGNFDIHDGSLYYKTQSLYDARVIMSYPAKLTWLANTQNALTSKNFRVMQTLIGLSEVYRDTATDKDKTAIHNEIATRLKKVVQRQRAADMICIYNLTCLMGMMFFFDETNDASGGIIPLTVYGSMLLVTVIMAFLKDKNDKEAKKLGTLIANQVFQKRR